VAAELVAEEGAAGLPLRLVEQPEGGLRLARETVVAHRAHQGLRRAGCYDAFGVIGTTFRELDWKTQIFFERVVPIRPNAWYSPPPRTIPTKPTTKPGTYFCISPACIPCRR
jgi:hypothetical protein